ncbi:unnamed protein product [Calypogeia fissa]
MLSLSTRSSYCFIHDYVIKVLLSKSTPDSNSSASAASCLDYGLWTLDPMGQWAGAAFLIMEYYTTVRT